jgi:hypothetical protein
MIISDLSYSTATDANVIGGFIFYSKKPKYVNVAYADAEAYAIGPNTKSSTETYAKAVYGVYSLSASSSYAKAY